MVGTVLLPDLGQPEHPRHQRRHHPEAQAHGPAVAEHMAQGHAGSGRHGGPQAQGHGIDPGHGPGVAREIALDDARQQHADHADAGARQDAPGEHPDLTERTAQDDAQGQGQQDPQHYPLGAETPGQYRSQGREQPQAKYRQGGQQAGLGRRQAQVPRHLAEQRRHARQRRTQVQRHQDQPQQQQPGATQHRGSLLHLFVVDLGVDQQFRRWGMGECLVVGHGRSRLQDSLISWREMPLARSGSPCSMASSRCRCRSKTSWRRGVMFRLWRNWAPTTLEK